MYLNVLWRVVEISTNEASKHAIAQLIALGGILGLCLSVDCLHYASVQAFDHQPARRECISLQASCKSGKSITG